MSADLRADSMIDFLKKEIIGDPGLQIDAGTPLLSSGLVDSFSLIEVLAELERVTGRRIPVGRVSPADFETVAEMLQMAERLGALATRIRE